MKAEESQDEEIRLGFVEIGIGGRWQPVPYLGLALRTGGYITSGDDDVEFEEYDGLHYEGSLALTVTAGPIRAQLGARVIAAAASVVRENSEHGEDDRWEFRLGGVFADIALSF